MKSLRIEGQKTVGIEIAQQFDWQVPDVIIIPGGNLGNVSALGSGLLMMRDLGLTEKLPRIVSRKRSGTNPLYRAYLTGFQVIEPITAEKTLASAIQIGNPVSIAKAIRTLRQFEGIVLDASEQERSDAAALADLSGMFTDPHTGVALAVPEEAGAGEGDRSLRTRGGHLDRQRPEVLGLQGRLPRGARRLPERTRQPAHRAATERGRREGRAPASAGERKRMTQGRRFAGRPCGSASARRERRWRSRVAKTA